MNVCVSISNENIRKRRFGKESHACMCIKLINADLFLITLIATDTNNDRFYELCMSRLRIAYSNHRRRFPAKRIGSKNYISSNIHACNYFTIPSFRVDINGGPFMKFHVCPEMK